MKLTFPKYYPDVYSTKQGTQVNDCRCQLLMMTLGPQWSLRHFCSHLRCIFSSPASARSSFALWWMSLWVSILWSLWGGSGQGLHVIVLGTKHTHVREASLGFLPKPSGLPSTVSHLAPPPALLRFDWQTPHVFKGHDMFWYTHGQWLLWGHTGRVEWFSSVETPQR